MSASIRSHDNDHSMYYMHTWLDNWNDDYKLQGLSKNNNDSQTVWCVPAFPVFEPDKPRAACMSYMHR